MKQSENDQRKTAKLMLWQERLAKMNSAYSSEYTKMDERERAYLGQHQAGRVTQNKARTRETDVHLVRNVTAELIETQVDINIPAPKITPKCSEDEDLAALAEAWLLAELDRLPSETLNDMDERTTRIQGGDYFVVDWDPEVRTHTSVGDIALHLLHPKQYLPQEGVWAEVAEQDYYIVKRAMTRSDVARRYKVSPAALENESESEPDIKGADSDSTRSMEEMLTVYTGTARGKRGLDRFVWVGDTVLEDLEDYQARRGKRCEACGAPASAAEMEEPKEGVSVELLGRVNPSAAEAVEATRPRPGRCPFCGGRLVDEPEEWEEVYGPLERTLREPIMPPADGSPLRIPRYKPDIYPVVLRRNIPLYGKLLGLSDVDRIADQQNALNNLENLITDKLAAAGSFLVLPKKLQVDDSNGQYKVIRLESASDKQMIDVINTEVPISQDMAWEATIYEHAKQQLGITDSFQGRRDSTATSGVAKEFSASQAASRLESRRVAKNVAWAKIYEIMFKFWLAYSDEPRRVVIRDQQNRPTYKVIDRYDFLKVDAAGELYWDDDFLFSTDDAQPLTNNRTQMWQETIQAFGSGLFGDPAQPDTLILVWTKLEELHYPLAAQTKSFLIEKQQQALEAMREQQAEAQMMQGMTSGAPGAGAVADDEETVRLDTARSAAAREAGGGSAEMAVM